MPNWTELKRLNEMLRQEIEEAKPDQISLERFEEICELAKRECLDAPRVMESFLIKAPTAWLKKYLPIDWTEDGEPIYG